MKHSWVTSKYCPVGIAIRNTKTLALRMALSKSKAKKAAEDIEAEEGRKCLLSESAGKGEKSGEGASAQNLV